MNTGGTTEALAKIFSQNRKYLELRDLTGDGVPELLINFSGLVILGCAGGKYHQLLQWPWTSTNPNTPYVYAVQDMNGDHKPEIVFYYPDSCGFIGRCSLAAIYQWDGQEFRPMSDDLGMRGPFAIEIKDLYKDGQLELLLEGGVGAWEDVFLDGLPWREQTDIYRWNSRSFSLYRTTFSRPQYRFEAAQDADELVRWKEYENALVVYQQVIANEDLDWWTFDKRVFQVEGWIRRTSIADAGNPAPTPLPLPQSDPAEYPNLAAYARYRIMLIHLVRGAVSAAQASYTLLQKTYQPGQPGYLYVGLARTVLDGFTQTNSLGAACRRGVSFADAHSPDILKYLGDLPNDPSPYHGWQSHKYVPVDLCPFK